MDIDRIIANQAANPGAARMGVYLTTQRATANYYADLAGGSGRGLGPAVLRVDVSIEKFNLFAAAHGTPVEADVPNPPFPGQTETVIPLGPRQRVRPHGPLFPHGVMP